MGTNRQKIQRLYDEITSDLYLGDETFGIDDGERLKHTAVTPQKYDIPASEARRDDNCEVLLILQRSLL